MLKYLTLFFLLILFCLVFPIKASAQVVINEFSVSPPDKYDWVELYSPTQVDISGWTLSDETGVFETYPEGTLLGPGIYNVVSKYQRLNNDQDTIYLKDKDGVEIDAIPYGYEGKVCIPSSDGSIARIPDGGNVIDRLAVNSKGATNGEAVTDPCPIPTPEPTDEPDPTPEPTSTPKPTATPTPKPTNTPTPKPTSTPKPTNTPAETQLTSSDTTGGTGSDNKDTGGEILGLKEEKPKSNFPYLAVALIGAGVLFLGISGFIFLKRRKKEYNLGGEK